MKLFGVFGDPQSICSPSWQRFRNCNCISQYFSSSAKWHYICTKQWNKKRKLMWQPLHLLCLMKYQTFVQIPTVYRTVLCLLQHFLWMFWSGLWMSALKKPLVDYLTMLIILWKSLSSRTDLWWGFGHEWITEQSCICIFKSFVYTLLCTYVEFSSTTRIV